MAKIENKNMPRFDDGEMSEDGLESPYPESGITKFMKDDKADDKEVGDDERPSCGGQYAEGGMVPRMADGDIVGGFDVDTGDSNTVKGLPMNPASIPPVEPAAPASAPITAKATNPRPMPGMPPDVTPDDLQKYLMGQKSQIQKYSPDQGYQTEQALLKARTGLPMGLANAGATFADALMQGVAQAGNPGFAQGLRQQEQDVTEGAIGAQERARKGTMEQMEAEQKIDMQDSASPLSKAYQKTFGPIFSKMGYDPKAVQGMSASEIGSAADLGVRYADAQTQLQLKEAMLQVQTLTAQANIQNAQSQRRQEAAKELGNRGLFKTLAGIVPGTMAHESKEALENELKSPGVNMVHPKAAAAMEWLRKNPKDPRAAIIRKRLDN